MSQFAPGESKTALAPIVIKPSGLSCSSELYLVSNGAKVATSGVKAFTSTGAKQDIRFPLTMPSAEGAYPVYLDIFTNGLLIGAYQATEDVVIATPVEKIYFRVIATFPASVRWQWGTAPWQYIIKMYVYTCSPADGGGFFSPVLKSPVGLSTPVGGEVGVYLPVYYSAGTLEATILPEHIKEEFAIPIEYEPGYYYYLCPSRISGELKVKIYEIWLDEGGDLASKKFITAVSIPTVVYPDARISIDLTPYCPAL